MARVAAVNMPSPSPEPAPPQQGNGLTRAILGESEVALFENVYAAHAAEARAIALAFLGDGDLAVDAVHNAYLEVLRFVVAGRRWADPAEARRVVLRNTRWAALKMLRTRRRRLEAELTGMVGEDDPAAWARSEARALCEQIVGGLRPAYQLAIRYRYIDGLSSAVAASRLGISVKAYEVRLHRAVRAAHRAASGTGVVGTLGALARARRQRRGGGHSGRGRQLTLVARVTRGAAGRAALLALVAAVPLLALRSGEGAATPSAVTVGAAVPAPRDSPLIDDTTLLDAVAVSARDGTVTVLAVGERRRCDCWEVFRSTDSGASWAASPAPAQLGAVARVEAPAGYPVDARIGLLAGDGRRWVAPRFGELFVPTAVSLPSHEGRQPVACHTTPFGARCGGSVIEGLPRADDGAMGTLLTLGATRLLYLRPYGGILCSDDTGVSWQVRCRA